MYDFDRAEPQLYSDPKSDDATVHIDGRMALSNTWESKLKKFREKTAVMLHRTSKI